MRGNEELYYIYGIICHEDERALCELEIRSLLGASMSMSASVSMSAGLNAVIGSRKVDASRSPFMKQRMDVLFAGESVRDVADWAAGMDLQGSSFKVQVWEARDTSSGQAEDEAAARRTAEDRRLIARQVGLAIRGQADLQRPDIEFGLVYAEGRWHFGRLWSSDGAWRKHHNKPRQYSTALSGRMARAVVNIAVPDPAGKTVIDPCCGIGTVLLEALSMGIAISGREINPLAAQGARENAAFYGYDAQVVLGDMREITQHYDAAILDMPYNLCSVLPEEDKRSMLQHAGKIADRLVVVTAERIDNQLEAAGLEILDRCIVMKGNFQREIIVLGS